VRHPVLLGPWARMDNFHLAVTRAENVGELFCVNGKYNFSATLLYFKFHCFLKPTVFKVHLVSTSGLQVWLILVKRVQ
jgi:hypothetical protein